MIHWNMISGRCSIDDCPHLNRRAYGRAILQKARAFIARPLWCHKLPELVATWMGEEIRETGPESPRCPPPRQGQEDIADKSPALAWRTGPRLPVSAAGNKLRRLSQNRDPPGLPYLIGVQPQEVDSRRERTRAFGIQPDVVNPRLDHPVDKGTDPAA